MNRSSWVPLLTKEGSGEVFERRVSNLPLAPSLVRRAKRARPCAPHLRRLFQLPTPTAPVSSTASPRSSRPAASRTLW